MSRAAITQSSKLTIIEALRHCGPGVPPVAHWKGKGLAGADYFLKPASQFRVMVMAPPLPSPVCAFIKKRCPSPLGM